jgi:hypothetical protein
LKEEIKVVQVMRTHKFQYGSYFLPHVLVFLGPVVGDRDSWNPWITRGRKHQEPVTVGRPCFTHCSNKSGMTLFHGVYHTHDLGCLFRWR